MRIRWPKWWWTVFTVLPFTPPAAACSWLLAIPLGTLVYGVWCVCFYRKVNYIPLPSTSAFLQNSAWGDGVLLFKPHARCVSCMAFSRMCPVQLLSGSYDGSLRCMDIEKAIFDEVSCPLSLHSFTVVSMDESQTLLNVNLSICHTPHFYMCMTLTMA